MAEGVSSAVTVKFGAPPTAGELAAALAKLDPASPVKVIVRFGGAVKSLSGTPAS